MENSGFDSRPAYQIGEQLAYRDLDKRREFFRGKYSTRHQKAIDLLGGKCVECSSIEDLEFDHVQPETKRFSLCKKLNNSPWERIEEELKLCQLLCHSCHSEKNKEDNGEAGHGTRTMYNHHGCRCVECRQANNEYFRNRRSMRDSEEVSR